MRRRELQSFQIKLNDLKEYEAARQERADKRSEKVKSESSPSEVTPIVKPGPKCLKEVRERIGLDRK